MCANAPAVKTPESCADVPEIYIKAPVARW
jgi:hypothetical protein